MCSSDLAAIAGGSILAGLGVGAAADHSIEQKVAQDAVYRFMNQPDALAEVQSGTAPAAVYEALARGDVVDAVRKLITNVSQSKQ